LLNKEKTPERRTKLNISELENKTILELYQVARDINLTGYSKLRKKELVFEITKALTHANELLQASGVLEIMPDGYGFLRPFTYVPSHEDIYVSPSQIRKFDLRTGDGWGGRCVLPKKVNVFLLC
jgi:transcription termination factor Rho